jgi:hypothetical protein
VVVPVGTGRPLREFIPSFDTSTELSGRDIRDLVAKSVREAEQPSEPYESGFPN